MRALAEFDAMAAAVEVFARPPAPVACRWVPGCGAPASTVAIAFLWWGVDHHLCCDFHAAGAAVMGMELRRLPLIDPGPRPRAGVS